MVLKIIWILIAGLMCLCGWVSFLKPNSTSKEEIIPTSVYIVTFIAALLIFGFLVYMILTDFKIINEIF